MQMLSLIRSVRFEMQVAMIALPDCEELQKTDRVLAIYEQLVVQQGLEKKTIDPKVRAAFSNFIAVAYETHGQKAPLAMQPPVFAKSRSRQKIEALLAAA